MNDTLPNPVPEADSLARSSVRGGASFVLARGWVDGLRLLSVLVLARLLTPAEFGVVAMVLAVIGIAEVLQDFGLSAASVQQRELSARHASTLMWINISLAALLAAATVLFAPHLASFLRVPEAAGVARLLAPTFLLSAIAAQHLALLGRSLRFTALARIRMVKAVVYTGVTIALAAAGVGQTSLVWGTLAAGALETASAVWAAPFRISRPRIEPAIRDVVRLGGGLLGYSVLSYIASAFPMLAIGRTHGASVAGTFGRGQRIVTLSTGYLISPIGLVAFPVLSRLASEPERWRRYYYEAQALLALPILGMAPFLLVHADAVVEVGLGPQWSDATPVVAAGAVTFLASLPCSPTSWVLVSLGRGARLLKWGSIGWLGVATGAALGLPYGGGGVATGIAAASVLLIWPCLAFSFRDTPVTVDGALRACAGPIPAALCAVAASWVAALATDGRPPALRLGVAIFVHAAVYVTVLALNPTERARARSVIDRLLRPSQKVATT